MPERRQTILVVDDDEGMRETLTAVLKRDYRVLCAATGETALQMMEKEDVALMLLDVRLPGISGFEVLKITKENYPYVEVIVISVVKELKAAIEAMRYGAYHYISKDFDIEGVRTMVANASERQDLSRHVMRLRAEVAQQVDREFVVGPSRGTREIIELVQKVATLSATVFILGESGTGKELLARLIHRESGAADAPFVAVNLAAIPRELVESTLFGHEKGAFTGALRQQFGCRPSSCAPSRKARSSASAEPIQSRPTSASLLPQIPTWKKQSSTARSGSDLPAFFGPLITGEQRRSAWLVRSRVLLGQREPASPASAHCHPHQHAAAL